MDYNETVKNIIHLELRDYVPFQQDHTISGTLSNQEAIDILLVESASGIADATNYVSLDITDSSRVHIASLRLDDTSRSHVEVEFLARWQLVVDEESVVGE